jgi:glycosyltransferase involved in cell wall biosynthesis
LNRIVFLPTRYFPSISGAEFYFQRLAEILSQKEAYEIDIFTSNAVDFKALRSKDGRIITKNDTYYDSVNKLEINRFSIDYSTSIETQMQKLRQIKSYNEFNFPDLSLKKILKNGPYLPNLLDFLLNRTELTYDLIHTTYFPYFNLIIALILGEQTKRPTICTPFFHFSNPRYSDSDLSLILSKFDLLIACTNKEKKALIEEVDISPEQIRVIPMGVDYSIYNSFSERSSFSFKKKFFDTGESQHKMVLFCGYKNYEKGAISILKAIPSILEDLKKVYFVFIGPSTKAFDIELSKIRNRTNASILNFTPDNLTGYFDKKKISAFNEANVVAMPSRSDAFGIVYLEAWASETPVIGANIGATPEVINDGQDGLLVEFDNPSDIAEKILTLLRNQKLSKQLAENGRKKVKSKFTWQKIAMKTHNIYQNIINETSL